VSRGVLRGFWLGAGVRDWRLLFPGSCHVRGERTAGSGTGRSPAASGGAAGVLEAAVREPDDGRRETGAGGLARGIRLCVQVRPVVSVWRAAVPLAAFIPSRVPSRGPGNAWGGPRQGAVRRGQSRRRPRRHEGGGAENRATSRLAAGQESCCCSCRTRRRRRVFGGPGQAADLAVAHPVVDQGEQPPRGGDLRDAPGLRAPPGGDGLLDGAGHRARGCPLDGLDDRPAQLP